MRRSLKALVRGVCLCVAIVVVTFSQANHGAAATVELDHEGNIALRGEIVKGDAEKLRALIERHGVRISTGVNRMLVLSSPGGNLEEADDIISVFWRGRNGGESKSGPLATVVPANAECLSSCALIFMHGQDTDAVEGRYLPSRWLHATALLGFHRPFFANTKKGTYTDEEFNRGVMVGHRLLDRITKRGAIDKSLVNVFLEYGANAHFDIATARQATRWGIGVYLKKPGVAPKIALTPEIAYTACYRNQYVSEDDDSEPNASARDYATYVGRKFKDLVTRKSQFKDAFNRRWKGVYEVQVETQDGSFDCYAWVDHSEENGSIYVENDGSEAFLIDWTYLLPPGLQLIDFEQFVGDPASFPAASTEPLKEKPPQSSMVTPAPAPAPEPAPGPVGPPLAEVRRGVICSAQTGSADIRLHPSASEFPMDKLANNTAVTLNGAPLNADGRSWYLVRFTTASGTEKLGYVSAQDVAAACSIASSQPRVEPEIPRVQPPEPAAPAARAAFVCNSAASFARVRRGPAPDFAQIATLGNGTGITVVGEKSNPVSGQLWFEVEFSANGASSRGFMDSDYIKDTCGEDGEVAAAQPPDQTPAAAEGSYVVCNRGSPYSNVRSGPAGKYDAVGSVNNHDTVTVSATANNPESGHAWYRIGFEDQGVAKEGYIDSDFLSISCDMPRTAASNRIVCNAKSVYSNVREGPGKTYPVIDKVYNGDRVWVVKGHRSRDTNHLWFGIAYGENNGSEGFIDADVALAECPASHIAGAR